MSFSRHSPAGAFSCDSLPYGCLFSFLTGALSEPDHKRQSDLPDAGIGYIQT